MAWRRQQLVAPLQNRWERFHPLVDRSASASFDIWSRFRAVRRSVVLFFLMAARVQKDVCTCYLALQRKLSSHSVASLLVRGAARLSSSTLDFHLKLICWFVTVCRRKIILITFPLTHRVVRAHTYRMRFIFLSHLKKFLFIFNSTKE